MNPSDASFLCVLAALAAYSLASSLGAFARALDRLGAVRRRAFAEEHSKSARILLDRPGGDAALRTALGALRSSAYVLTTVLFVESLSVLGIGSPALTALLVGVPLVAATEIGLSVVVRRGRAARVLILLAPVVRPLVAPLLPFLDPISESNEPSNATDSENPPEEPSDETVKAFLDIGREEGILEEGERKLVESIVDFGERVVREVMTPRLDMIALPAGTPLSQLAQKFVETKFARIPVYRENVDQIFGIVHVQDLLSALVSPGPRSAAAGGLAHPALFVPETTPISNLMAELQEKKLQMAIVLDEFGGVSGLVTLEDLLEEIVGEIGDEHEEAGEEEIHPIGEGEWRLSARCRVEAVAELFGLERLTEEESPDVDTIGGLLAAKLGHIPRVGESTRIGEVEFQIDTADRQRVRTILVRRVSAPEMHPEKAGGDADRDGRETASANESRRGGGA